MNKERVESILKNNDYYSIDDLRYNKKVGIMFSKDEFCEFLEIKDQMIDDGLDIFCKIPLKTFNSKHCFFVKSEYLKNILSEYLRIYILDYKIKHSTFLERNIKDMLVSRLFSEVEGTLKVENVPTTHKRIAEVRKMEKPVEKNDIIIKNMFNAIDYIIKEKPRFNKENLLKLYNILSNDCLKEEDKLKENNYYRHDSVYVDKYEGADYKIVEECMDSLFAFANNEANIKEFDILLPYICHYYILYVHPYFDYNGRTARMVSFWLNYINEVTIPPFFMSEAINDSKTKYYEALTNTRETNNDLTYFLGYIMETSIKYMFVYKNIEEIKSELEKTGDTLSGSEWLYIKKIIINKPEDYFNYKMFLEFLGLDMTKQGALKILNKFVDYGILDKSKNKRNETIFKMKDNMITYKYSK